MSEFVPFGKKPDAEEIPKLEQQDIGQRNNHDKVKDAQDAKAIAEALLGQRLAEEGVQKIDDLKMRESKVIKDREAFEKQKVEWIARHNKSCEEEKEKLRQLRTYFTEQAQPLKQQEEALSKRKQDLDTREQFMVSREQSLSDLDILIEHKQKQVGTLQDIINDKAPAYYKWFKRVARQGEYRADWNYNIARADQWHNFTERIRIITDSLNRMLFGD
jgi:hypothetical protein